MTVGRCLKKNQAWVPQGKTIVDRWVLAVCLSVKDQVLQKHWVKQKEWLICWPLPKLGTVKIGSPGVTLCTMVCDGVTRKTYQLGIDQKKGKFEQGSRSTSKKLENWLTFDVNGEKKLGIGSPGICIWVESELSKKTELGKRKKVGKTAEGLSWAQRQSFTKTLS